MLIQLIRSEIFTTQVVKKQMQDGRDRNTRTQRETLQIYKTGGKEKSDPHSETSLLRTARGHRKQKP